MQQLNAACTPTLHVMVLVLCGLAIATRPAQPELWWHMVIKTRTALRAQLLNNSAGANLRKPEAIERREQPLSPSTSDQKIADYATTHIQRFYTPSVATALSRALVTDPIPGPCGTTSRQSVEYSPLASPRAEDVPIPKWSFCQMSELQASETLQSSQTDVETRCDEGGEDIGVTALDWTAKALQRQRPRGLGRHRYRGPHFLRSTYTFDPAKSPRRQRTMPLHILLKKLQ